MSLKVLLLSPVFPYSFWSYTESCAIQGVKAMTPPLGLLTAAGLLPREWSLRFVDLNTSELQEKDWEWAEMVMISAMLAQHDSALELVAECRRRKLPCVVGGPYPTSLPETFVAAGCDFLILGEGEKSVPLFLEALQRGEISGIFTCEDKPDLATESPIPRYDLIRFDNYSHVPVQISRGCPFDCEFCDIVHLYGRKQRYKTPEQVLTELEIIYNLGYRHHIFIVDDNIIGNKAKAKEILERLIEWNKRFDEPFGFGAQASIDLGQDPEMIDLLTAANFGEVFVGIESPDAEVLRKNAKHHNVTNPLAVSLHNLRANGLSVLASFVIGFDGEKPGIAERIMAFVEENSLPVVMLNQLYVIPNTKLSHRIEAEGRLKANLFGEYMRGGLNYIPERPEGEILEDYIRLWEYLYEPSRFLTRAYRSCLIIRPTRAHTARKSGLPHEQHQTRKRHQRDVHWAHTNRLRLFSLARIIWHQGIKAPYRMQFWGQLIGMLYRNPSRIVRYLITCGMGESMFAYRRYVLSWRQRGK
jgi:radical SAM superfamily enzyme YgiQ (UPF0313 family)